MKETKLLLILILVFTSRASYYLISILRKSR